MGLAGDLSWQDGTQEKPCPGPGVREKNIARWLSLSPSVSARFHVFPGSLLLVIPQLEFLLIS